MYRCILLFLTLFLYTHLGMTEVLQQASERKDLFDEKVHLIEMLSDEEMDAQKRDLVCDLLTRYPEVKKEIVLRDIWPKQQVDSPLRKYHTDAVICLKTEDSAVIDFLQKKLEKFVDAGKKREARKVLELLRRMPKLNKAIMKKIIVLAKNNILAKNADSFDDDLDYYLLRTLQSRSPLSLDILSQLLQILDPIISNQSSLSVKKQRQHILSVLNVYKYREVSKEELELLLPYLERIQELKTLELQKVFIIGVSYWQLKNQKIFDYYLKTINTMEYFPAAIEGLWWRAYDDRMSIKEILLIASNLDIKNFKYTNDILSRVMVRFAEDTRIHESQNAPLLQELKQILIQKLFHFLSSFSMDEKSSAKILETIGVFHLESPKLKSILEETLSRQTVDEVRMNFLIAILLISKEQKIEYVKEFIALTISEMESVNIPDEKKVLDVAFSFAATFADSIVEQLWIEDRGMMLALRDQLLTILSSQQEMSKIKSGEKLHGIIAAMCLIVLDRNPPKMAISHAMQYMQDYKRVITDMRGNPVFRRLLLRVEKKIKL